MSNSPTERISTTGSSHSSRSDEEFLPPVGGQGGTGGWHPPVGGSPGGLCPPGANTEIITCGALAGHIREIAARRGWPVTVRPLPARLHNRPEKIPEHTERAAAAARAAGSAAVVAYADCGTYGALDKICDAHGGKRLPGLHCYDVFAGPDRVAGLLAEEPASYLLTDYLVRTFDRTVLASLGLDRHPELWSDYFGHYRRVVWLAQEPTPELEAAAARIAGLFRLPLTRVDTGLARLEAALAELVEEGR